MSAIRVAALALRMLWASPCSAMGLVCGLVLLAAGGSARRCGRTIELALHAGERPAGSAPPYWPFAAITFGHVILGVSHAELGRLRVHEHAHVRQYELFGPLLLVAYPACGLWAWLRGASPYRDNWFERQAFAVEDHHRTATALEAQARRDSMKSRISATQRSGASR